MAPRKQKSKARTPMDTRGIGFSTKEDEQAHREIFQAYGTLFNTATGKKVLADILTRFGAAAPAYDPRIKHPAQSAETAIFNAGMYAAALEIFTLAGGVPEHLGRAIINDRLEESI